MNANKIKTDETLRHIGVKVTMWQKKKRTLQNLSDKVVQSSSIHLRHNRSPCFKKNTLTKNFIYVFHETSCSYTKNNCDLKQRYARSCITTKVLIWWRFTHRWLWGCQHFVNTKINYWEKIQSIVFFARKI